MRVSGWLREMIRYVGCKTFKISCGFLLQVKRLAQPPEVKFVHSLSARMIEKEFGNRSIYVMCVYDWTKSSRCIQNVPSSSSFSGGVAKSAFISGVHRVSLALQAHVHLCPAQGFFSLVITLPAMFLFDSRIEYPWLPSSTPPCGSSIPLAACNRMPRALEGSKAGLSLLEECRCDTSTRPAGHPVKSSRAS